MEKAVFGAGCFWSVQAQFDQVEGVTKTVAGYAGGTISNPTYEQVCQGDTGHTEVVYIEYDPKKVSYEELLELFFEMHDASQVNRQGPDVGFQYRSVIFYNSEKQKQEALDFINMLEEEGQEVATKVEPIKRVYPAEEYHQKYLAKRNLGLQCSTK